MITKEDREQKIEGDNPEMDWSTEVIEKRIACLNCGGTGEKHIAHFNKPDTWVCVECWGDGYKTIKVVERKRG